MATETVSVQLPEDIYRRLEGVADATRQPLEEIIYQTIRANLPPTVTDLSQEQRDLVADLAQLRDDALWAVARETLPADQWRKHQRLLQRATKGPLSDREQAILAELRALADRFVIRRSYALALLKWHGHTIPISL